MICKELATPDDDLYRKNMKAPLSFNHPNKNVSKFRTSLGEFFDAGAFDAVRSLRNWIKVA